MLGVFIYEIVFCWLEVLYWDLFDLYLIQGTDTRFSLIFEKLPETVIVPFRLVIIPPRYTFSYSSRSLFANSSILSSNFAA